MRKSKPWPRSRRALLICLVVTIQASGMVLRRARGQTDQGEERTLIEQTARDYIEGWYSADAERMARALHPDMVKRYVDALPGGRQVVHSVTRDIMVEMTSSGGGSKTPLDQRNIAVHVLDISGDIAVVKTTSSEYLDLLSLAKCNGRWVIVNVLWRFQSGAAVPR